MRATSFQSPFCLGLIVSFNSLPNFSARLYIWAGVQRRRLSFSFFSLFPGGGERWLRQGKKPCLVLRSGLLRWIGLMLWREWQKEKEAIGRDVMLRLPNKSGLIDESD
ncbi:hypothetical protein IEQ34_004495 [Dendrobium chrysotoxum]|uniref:Uncharacterized protein n=1 Tax=Dendrobium chrysotoxum TaxID=161865 RepID=A0AAV7HG19_DENCH|nr:hypothetical protein IEQ34_004495 [Dendrobium chrysotoxum]